MGGGRRWSAAGPLGFDFGQVSNPTIRPFAHPNSPRLLDFYCAVLYCTSNPLRRLTWPPIPPVLPILDTCLGNSRPSTWNHWSNPLHSSSLYCVENQFCAPTDFGFVLWHVVLPATTFRQDPLPPTSCFGDQPANAWKFLAQPPPNNCSFNPPTLPTSRPPAILAHIHRFLSMICVSGQAQDRPSRLP